MKIYELRLTLLIWHPWWSRKKVFGWKKEQVLAVYYKCLEEDEDKMFDKYCKHAFASKTLEGQAEVMSAYYKRFTAAQ